MEVEGEVDTREISAVGAAAFDVPDAARVALAVGARRRAVDRAGTEQVAVAVEDVGAGKAVG